ncbi:MAG: hypothetical protein H6658_14450 [Ardenticatenaceae bacterium]|nr:hypothetical protein [Ardenticatenaceae bacterium]
MIFFFAASLFFCSFGLHRLKGPVSVSYLDHSFMLKDANYLALPGALTFLLMGLALSPIVLDELKLTVLMVGIAAPFILAWPASKYLKPKWLRWLEQNHKDIIPFLQAEIQEMGPEIWDKQINTKEELESWVNQVKQRRGIV